MPPSPGIKKHIEHDPALKDILTAFAAATGFTLRLDADPTSDGGLPIVAAGQLVGRLEGAGDPGQRRAAQALASAVVASRLTTISLAGHVARLWKAMHFVYRLGESMANPGNLALGCREILDHALDAVGAARGSIYLLEDGELRPVAARGIPDHHLVPIALGDGSSIAAWVVKHGAPLVLNDASRRPPALEAHGFPLPASGSDSLICVPLEVGNHTAVPLGIMNLALKLDGHFTSDDQRLVTAIARLAAGFIHRGRLMALEIAHQRLEQELQLAADIHAGMLPAELPALEDLEAAAALESSSAVGGDYYDILAVAGRVYALMADVAGHGLGAALLVGTVRSTMRAACRAGLAPSEVLARLNDVMTDIGGKSGVFATAQVVALDHDTARIAAAAHPPALAVTPGNGVRRVEAAGPPVGVVRGASFPEATFKLGEHETLVMYTDGVLPVPGNDGVASLAATLAELQILAPSELVEWIVARGHRPAADTDDRTALAIRRR